jgi:formylglycine-generating enzyme required for sulfatase activity
LALKHLAEQAGRDADALGKQLQKQPDLSTVLAELRADGLPDLVWCKVDGGPVTLEIERTGRLGRLLGGTRSETFPVRPFSIAQYHVTWVQYRAFLEAPDGFGNPAWWEGCPTTSTSRAASSTPTTTTRPRTSAGSRRWPSAAG